MERDDMTRVAGIAPGVSLARRATRSAGGFALPGEPAATPPAAASAAVATLVAIQEQGPVLPAGERARRRAGRVLDELRQLQLELLRGAVDPSRLERLAALNGAVGTDDPIVAEIALRARVELARRRVALRAGHAALPDRSASAV
jgi:hypothetical protein